MKKHWQILQFLGSLFFIGSISGLLYADVEIPRQLPSQVLDRLSPCSFNRYYRNVYSQVGEDGIIEEVFRRIGGVPGLFVDIGGEEGSWYSTTRALWERGWHGVIIEAREVKYRQLLQFYPNPADQKVLCIQELVTWDKNDSKGRTFDQIADSCFPSREIDFLSLSYDGAGYLIFESLQRKPRVICLEGGLHWHPHFVEKVPIEYAVQNLAQPLEVLIDIAKSKGYKPLCFTGNLILIRSDLYHLFQGAPLDTLSLWRDGWRSSFSRKWLVTYRKYHPFISRVEGFALQMRCPITYDF